MKRLLIATDFSPAAQSAVDYGIQLAKDLNAAVTVVTAYEEIPVPVSDTMSMTFIDTAASRNIVEQGLTYLRRHIQQNNLPPVRTVAVKGLIVPAILNSAAEWNADLIITGMKGKGRSVRRLLGNTATTLARKTSIPLLVVPEDAAYTPLANILFANDIRPDTDIHALDPLRELVAAFRSQLYVLRILQNGTEEFVQLIHNQAPLQLLDSTWKVKYEYKIGDDVVSALNKFTRTHDIQLVVMVPHPHSLPERWFMGSYTREMIFEASIPLLLLPEHN